MIKKKKKTKTFYKLHYHFSYYFNEVPLCQNIMYIQTVIIKNVEDEHRKRKMIGLTK
jgi:hypothetical protein